MAKTKSAIWPFWLIFSRLKTFLKNLSAFLDLNFDEESIKSFFNLLLHFLVNFEFRRNNFFWRQIVIEKSNSKTYPEKNVRVQKIYIIWMGEKIIGGYRTNLAYFQFVSLGKTVVVTPVLVYSHTFPACIQLFLVFVYLFSVVFIVCLSIFSCFYCLSIYFQLFLLFVYLFSVVFIVCWL